MFFRFRASVLFWLFASCLLEWGSLADWPGYRGGANRRAHATTPFPKNLRLAWQFKPSQAPAPAWPAPAGKSYWQQLDSIAARAIDDHTFHPVVYQNHVFFGSSGDDHLYCLRASTGELRWRFATEGPIRFAPFLTDDRCYFGSDDGYFYCVEIRSGEPIWRRLLSETDRRIPGNGRLISSAPVRTGCVLIGEHVYVAAGLYPQQGAWAYALDARTGDVVWRTVLDVSPQGYLLASSTQLFVPTGRSLPIVLDLESGDLQRQMNTIGGTFAVLEDDVLVGGQGNDGSLAYANAASGSRLLSVKGQHLSVGERQSVLLDGERLVVIDRGRFRSAMEAMHQWETALKTLPRVAAGTADVDQADIRRRRAAAAESLRAAENELDAARREVALIRDATVLVSTPEVGVVGTREGIEAIDLVSGQRRWTMPLSEPVLGMALDENHLIATGVSGNVYGFVSRESEVDPRLIGASEFTASERRAEQSVSDSLKRAIAGLPVDRGYAVLLGDEAAAIRQQITEATQLKVVVSLAEEASVHRVRSSDLSAGAYGSTSVVHQLAGRPLPYVDDFAVLVIHSDSKKWASEAWRIARPYGGVVLNLSSGAIRRRGAIEGAGQWTHLYGTLSNTCSSDDALVGSELELQWFGGLGPRRLVDRHLRGSPPLFQNGILVVPGENLLVGVDAATGEELWQLDAPGSQRYSMPFDAGYMSLKDDILALAVRDECWFVDIRRGIRLQQIPLPGSTPNRHWGYVALDRNQLIGTIQSETASRTIPSRGQIDSDYRNAQGIVCGESLFAMDERRHSLQWRRQQGVFLNPTLTCDEASIFLVEGSGATSPETVVPRLRLEEFMTRQPRLTAVDRATGSDRWSMPLPESLRRCLNILYLCQSGGKLVAVGSWLNSRNDSTYEVVCFSATDGSVQWEAQHDKGKPGQTFHGEQMHHPVIIGDLLVTEPVVYNLQSGERIRRSGQSTVWQLDRPGHSCGTISASQSSIYFRAGNPTALNLRVHLVSDAEPLKLSPTRPGCWINMIPAGGLLLIPEASSGCVCNFSLQTSMAFRPR